LLKLFKVTLFTLDVAWFTMLEPPGSLIGSSYWTSCKLMHFRNIVHCLMHVQYLSCRDHGITLLKYMGERQCSNSGLNMHINYAGCASVVIVSCMFWSKLGHYGLVVRILTEHTILKRFLWRYCGGCLRPWFVAGPNTVVHCVQFLYINRYVYSNKPVLS
jgi:hypothetical protein